MKERTIKLKVYCYNIISLQEWLINLLLLLTNNNNNYCYMI